MNLLAAKNANMNIFEMSPPLYLFHSIFLSLSLCLSERYGVNLTTCPGSTRKYVSITNLYNFICVCERERESEGARAAVYIMLSSSVHSNLYIFIVVNMNSWNTKRLDIFPEQRKLTGCVIHESIYVLEGMCKAVMYCLHTDLLHSILFLLRRKEKTCALHCVESCHGLIVLFG